MSAAPHTLATFIAAIAHHASLPIATSVDEGDLLGGSLLTHVDVDGGRITAVLRDYRTSDSDEGDGYDTLVFVVQPDVAVTSTEDLPDSIDAAIVAICEALIAVQDSPAPVALRGEVSQTLLDLADALAVARPEDASRIDDLLAGPATSEAVSDLRGLLAVIVAGTGSSLAWDLYRESGAYTLDSMVGREPAPGSDDDTYPAVPHPIEAVYSGAWVAVYGSDRTAHVEATRALPPAGTVHERRTATDAERAATAWWLIAEGVLLGETFEAAVRELRADYALIPSPGKHALDFIREVAAPYHAVQRSLWGDGRRADVREQALREAMTPSGAAADPTGIGPEGLSRLAAEEAFRAALVPRNDVSGGDIRAEVGCVWVGPIPVSQQRAFGDAVGFDRNSDVEIPVHGAYVPVRAGGVGHPSVLIPVQTDGTVTTASSRRRMHLTTEGWFVEVPDRRGNLRFQVTGDADHRPLDPVAPEVAPAGCSGFAEGEPEIVRRYDADEEDGDW